MENRSPIYFVDLEGFIQNIRNKKIAEVSAKGIVAKGTINEIKNCDRVKRRFLRSYLNTNKKIKDFDLSRIIITHVSIRNSLGYGIKRK